MSLPFQTKQKRKAINVWRLQSYVYRSIFNVGMVKEITIQLLSQLSYKYKFIISK